jgi:hypothetical protein
VKKWFIFIFAFVSFGWEDTGVIFMFAWQVPYHLYQSPNPFCYIYFSSRVSHFCLRPTSGCGPPTYSLPVTGKTDTCQHTQLID